MSIIDGSARRTVLVETDGRALLKQVTLLNAVSRGTRYRAMLKTVDCLPMAKSVATS